MAFLTILAHQDSDANKKLKQIAVKKSEINRTDSRISVFRILASHSITFQFKYLFSSLRLSIEILVEVVNQVVLGETMRIKIKENQHLLCLLVFRK